jgi:hypothetical protein
VKKIGLIAGIIVVIAIAALLGYIAFRPQTSQSQSSESGSQSQGQESGSQPPSSDWMYKEYYLETDAHYRLTFPQLYVGKESGGFKIENRGTYVIEVIASGTFERKGDKVHFHRIAGTGRYPIDFEMRLEYKDGKFKLIYETASGTEVWVAK